MAIYISSEFNINPNIAKKPSTVLDSSWVYGAMVYADSVDELPTHNKLVRQGNLGSVKDPKDPNKALLYQAHLDSAGKIYWSRFQSASSNDGGYKEVYYSAAELEQMSEAELRELPDDLLVVEDENVLVPNSLLNSLLETVNQLKREVTQIKNTFNDMSAVDIEETNSNYGSYISFDENVQPRTEVDWKDSSNGNIVYTGTASKFGTEAGAKVDWINADSSEGWFENWKGQKVDIYSSSVVNSNTYPYDEIPEDGIDPETNMLSDGADEKLTLRHFAPKYAKTYAIMNTYKTSLIPYELVLCLENNSLYYYHLKKNRMIILAGGDSSTDPGWTPDDDDPINPNPPSQNTETKFEIDSNGILEITDESGAIFVDSDGYLHLNGEVDSNGILILNNVEKEIVNSLEFEVDENGILTITGAQGINVGSDGILDISASVNNDILNLNNIQTETN